MSVEGKGGLTLPWLWVAVLIAYLSFGFMLPPFDGPLENLAKMKPAPADDQTGKGDEIVF